MSIIFIIVLIVAEMKDAITFGEFMIAIILVNIYYLIGLNNE